MTKPNTSAEIEKIEESIRQLEKMKVDGSMPAELADASIEALKTRRATYQAQVQGGGASAQGDKSTAIGQQGVGVDGSVSSSLINTGTIFQIYQSASGKPRLDEAGFERILRNYLEWLRKARFID